MNLKIDLEWVCGVIRIGDEKFLGAEPGTTYNFVCGIMRKGDEAHLYGAHGTMNRRVFKAIIRKLRDAGVRKITYDRLNTDTARSRSISTSALMA